MNNFGITPFFGKEKGELSNREVFSLIKINGFDNIMTSTEPSFESQSGSLTEQIELAKEFKLNIYSIHSKNKGYDIDAFWLNTQAGKNYFLSLVDDIKICYRYKIKILVIHLDNGSTEHITKIGIRRLKKLLKLASICDVYLAIENTFNIDLMDEIMSINHDNLKMCYDIGHEFGISKSFPYLLEKYIDKKIICYHLHDNSGKADEHFPLGYGNINWNFVKSKFDKRPDIPLTLEVLKVPKDLENLTFKEYLTYLSNSLSKHLN